MEDEKDHKMTEKPISEDALISELDTMYRRVADIEKKEEEDTEILDFLKEKPLQEIEKENRSHRIFILAMVGVIIALVVAVILYGPMIPLPFLKTAPLRSLVIITPPVRKKPPSQTISVQPVPIPPEQKPIQTAPEEAKKDKPVNQEPSPAEVSPPGGKFTIQIGIFRNTENVQRLLKIFKEEGLEAYPVTMKRRKRILLHKVFVGRFADKEKAGQFLKDKKILKNYPESFVHELSPAELNYHQLQAGGFSTD